MFVIKKAKSRTEFLLHKRSIEKFIIPVMSINLRNIIINLSPELMEITEEIRLKRNQPLMIVGGNMDFFIDKNGQAVQSKDLGYMVKKEDIIKTLNLITDNSVYAFEEEIKHGFITIKGGHRVGLCGKTVIQDGRIKTIKNISSLNIRIAREIIGCSNTVIKYIIKPPDTVYNTLIVSPPQCGKTTMLRDIARQLSDGCKKLGFRGVKVGIVDERSEIASCYMGKPQKRVGVRTDVLDGCPKALGMILLIRSMSPQVIVVDEIGSREDVCSIGEAINAGTKLITSVHGASMEELMRRPAVNELIAQRVFERIVFLSNKKGPGSIEKIINGIDGSILYRGF